MTRHAFVSRNSDIMEILLIKKNRLLNTFYVHGMMLGVKDST